MFQAQNVCFSKCFSPCFLYFGVTTISLHSNIIAESLITTLVVFIVRLFFLLSLPYHEDDDAFADLNLF
jgi:hypothetical protein